MKSLPARVDEIEAELQKSNNTITAVRIEKLELRIRYMEKFLEHNLDYYIAKRMMR